MVLTVAFITGCGTKSAQVEVHSPTRGALVCEDAQSSPGSSSDCLAHTPVIGLKREPVTRQSPAHNFRIERTP
jgi:hypothetical protein